MDSGEMTTALALMIDMLENQFEMCLASDSLNIYYGKYIIIMMMFHHCLDFSSSLSRKYFVHFAKALTAAVSLVGTGRRR